jgi:hypothetical protein
MCVFLEKFSEILCVILCYLEKCWYCVIADEIFLASRVDMDAGHWWLTPVILPYSRGRDQEDHGSKPAQANSLSDPILKNPSQKLGLVEWLKVKALSSSPSTTKKRVDMGGQ